MYCDRCGEEDRVMRGTKEHPHGQWLGLCPWCVTELSEDQLADALMVEEHRQRQQAPYNQPVTQSRGFAYRVGRRLQAVEPKKGAA